MRNFQTMNCLKRAAILLPVMLFAFVATWADVKWVKRDVSKLQTGDVVVIVESNNAVALTNNPGSDKNPEAASVVLNEDLNRITSEVPDTLKWRVTVAEGPKYRFERVDSAGRYLNVTDGNLRVGEVTARYSFDHTGSLLHIGVGNNDYYIGVKVTDQMISKNYEWNTKTDASDADIKESKIEFFVMSEKPDITLGFPYRNYEADYNGGAGTFAEPTLTVDPSKSISFSSSDDNIASIGSDGKVTLKKRGNVKIFASFDGDETYNEYDTHYVLRIDDTPKKGSRTNPFTPQEVNDLLAGNVEEVDGVSLQKGCSYFVKGIVSKVSSGMMDMMGGMMGDKDMDDISMPAMGMMGGSVNYYISADGTTDGQIKVLNPNGQPVNDGNAVILTPMDEDALGVGDVVTVYGPLIYTEDNDMMSSIGGSGDNSQKYTPKVDEVNYIKDGGVFARMTATSLDVMQENTTKSPSDFYEINTDTLDGIPFTGTLQPATMKSSNEEVAKWVYTDEEKTDSVFTALKAGTTKLTIKVKVILQADDPATTDTNEEKSYTMKEKIRLTVTTRNQTPAGQNVGTFRLVTDVTKLEEGDSLLLVVPAEDGNVQVMGTDKAMMGGISPVEASLLTNDNNEDVLVGVPLDGQVVRLAKVAGENGYWYLKTGDTSYLSATADSGNSMGGMGGSNGLKSGISEETPGDTAKVTISISEGLATIRFKAPEGDDKKNIIKFGASSFSFGGGGTSQDSTSTGGGSSMPDMGAMMGSVFNTYESTDTKAALPRLYRFVQSNEYPLTIGETKWATLVSAYDVVMPEEFVAYVVTEISEGKAIMTPVPAEQGVKAGVPYLIKGPEEQGTYYLTKAEQAATAPETNLLAISDDQTASGVYVLAKKNGEAGFYKWNGGLLGAGRVYLPLLASSSSPAMLKFEFVENDDDVTRVASVESNDAAEEQSWYTLSGVKLLAQPTAKGIYIRNGKKVIIK